MRRTKEAVHASDKKMEEESNLGSRSQSVGCLLSELRD